jgi:hypothetical protein
MVSVGRTINIGNYESVRYEFSVDDVVKAGEKPSEAKTRLKNVAEGWLNDAVKEVETAVGKSQRTARS